MSDQTPDLDLSIDDALGHAEQGPILSLQRAIDALLDTPWPADWNEPTAVARRVASLEGAAVKAGEAMIEFLTRLNGERARGVHMREGGCAAALTDALFALHRALVRFSFEVPQRRDGLFVASSAIEAAHGMGVADLTMAALSEARELIMREMSGTDGPSPTPGSPYTA